ncbi:MAG: alpha/beta hydrolase [Anaerolineales bacterium]|jgi:hypothetical protein
MKKIGIGVLIVLGVALLVWLNYALFTGKIFGLSDDVTTAMESDDEVEVALMEDGDWLVMTPAKTVPAAGLIFYPEGRMEIQSYALVGREIAQKGYLIVFLSRRLDQEYDLIEEEGRIETVMAAYPDIDIWVIGAHTFGGPVAVDYAASHPERVAGLVLWAGRVEGAASLADCSLPVLMVYGTVDDEKTGFLASAKTHLPGHTVWVAIEGGNRTQFANFGPMSADPGATITSEEQQAQAIAATLDFLDSLSGD